MRVYASPQANTFDDTWDAIRDSFLFGDAREVDTGHWQSRKGTPHSQTRELMHTLIEVPIQPTRGSWQSYMHPNLPWAEDHFQERISGEPSNPGEEYKNWPWYRGGVEDHKPQGKFSHTYMERFWPKEAGEDDTGYEDGQHRGIRFKYGDLDDLKELLAREPHTRQAYLPIWFPEDIHAAAIDHQRVPCTLGYHFLLRDERLHCFYPMRSVDFVRYLRDDIYLAGRLVQHLCHVVPGFLQMGIQPGRLSLFASSLHIFEGDVPKLVKEAELSVAEDR